MTGTPGPLDQLLGIGDGLTARFQLAKSYGEGDEPQVRPITRPRLARCESSVGGVEPTAIDSRAGRHGRARRRAARCGRRSARGLPVRRAGALCRGPARRDRRAFAAGEAPSVPLIEVREAV